MLSFKRSTAKKIRIHIIKFGLLFGILYTINSYQKNIFLKKSDSRLFSQLRLKPKRQIASIPEISVLRVECHNLVESRHIATGSKTLRLELSNCKKDISIEQHSHKNTLSTFNLGENNFTSEFAYLKKGSNQFTITAGGSSQALTIDHIENTNNPQGVFHSR